MSKQAAEKCLHDAGININNVDIIELHDCFAPNEVYLYMVGIKCVCCICASCFCTKH